MKADRNVDFYITSASHVASTEQEWLVCKESLSYCVAIHDDLAAATADAIQMADFDVACGQVAQVHVQEHPSAQWRTVWCSPGAIPRFA